MGAVSRSGILRLPSTQPLFDVEQFRPERHRLALARKVTGPTLVLGSTQPAELVDSASAGRGGVEVARRRGGGGAVYLESGRQLWIDAWIPRDDPLWAADVSGAASWVGEWWTEALALGGQRGFDVHAGRAVPGAFGELVCFAGRGPGEVFHDGRKVVGLSQWRAREGALFSSCAYLHWDPAPLVELLDVGEQGGRAELVAGLMPVAVGVGELGPPVGELGALRRALLDSFGALGIEARGGEGDPGAP